MSTQKWVMPQNRKEYIDLAVNYRFVLDNAAFKLYTTLVANLAQMFTTVENF